MSSAREPGRSKHGGPYREAAEGPQADREWGGPAFLLFVTAPWLMPLWQALRGQDSFGWSAAVGLILSLSLLVASVRMVAGWVTRRKHSAS